LAGDERHATRTGWRYGTLKEGNEMATQNNVRVSDELLAELQSKALAAGKTVDDLAEEALRKGLEEQSWQDLLAYGLQTGRESGYTEADVPGIVKARRKIIAAERR
jgi:predicted transcriptional regulator